MMGTRRILENWLRSMRQFTAWGVSNQISHSETTKLEAYCIPRFVFDQLLYKRAINAGCNFLTQTVNKNDYHQELYDAFDTSLMRVAFMQAR